MISVIIIAYNRKIFLKDAIKSVLNQSLDRNLYEIIIVKNFKDKDIDDFIDQNSLINIFSEDNTILGKILEGIKNSKGDIIAFLEDDDRFQRDKLKIVNEIFSDEDVVYYHNAAQYIDEDGRFLNRINYGISFNLSSITVRKSIIKTELMKNPVISYTSDFFIYLCAIESGGKIISDKRTLTYYMQHKNSSTYQYLDDYINYSKSMLEIFEKSLISCEIFLANFKNDNVKKLCKYKIIFLKMGTNKKLSYRELFYYLLFHEKYSDIIIILQKYIGFVNYFMPSKIQNLIGKILFKKRFSPMVKK
jgi:glycosyltransferase involved in cell wall biosynthesis